jgi:hypothetical protein
MGTRSACITTLMEQEAERRRRAPRPYENWTTARIHEEIERSRKTADAYMLRAADYIKRGKPEIAGDFNAGAVRHIALIETFNAELAVRRA